MSCWLEDNRYVFAAGIAAICHWLVGVLAWIARHEQHTGQPTVAPAPAGAAQVNPSLPTDTSGLVEQMLAQDRFALLLRPEIVGNLDPWQRRRAWAALREKMTLVPAGEIRIGQGGDPDKQEDDFVPLSGTAGIVRVEHFMLDRDCVTNRQYHAFVAAVGYEQMSIWDPEIWPGMLDFVDQTGQPGPRFWTHGCYPVGLDDHPVVGVSWYEAAAYARWVGKRLPTDPEWEKAGSWPMQLSGAGRPQRRFPWGDSFDSSRANLWGTGPATTVPVGAFPEGISVGGVNQLVGNVWEWTTGNFGAWCVGGQDLILATPTKTVRGGAFDTYFECHATCQFHSGEDPTSRKHNLGFRCALSICDLACEPGHADELTTGAGEAGENRSLEEVFV